MLSASIEDYIKVIYSLRARGERASTKRIAQALDVKMASVTGMIKHLASEGYLRHTPYRGVELTPRGREVALRMIRRHRLIEQFLVEVLRMGWDEVDADAEVLEHVMSDRLIERIYDALGKPEFDPHGSPIPGRDGEIRAIEAVSMAALEDGEQATVLQVSDRDPEFLRYLTKLGIKIGTKVRLIEQAPFDGPLTLRVGRRRILLGREAAGRIMVGERDK
jgi:DtxR family Mn-dependent transcriptional regulator